MGYIALAVSVYAPTSGIEELIHMFIVGAVVWAVLTSGGKR